MNPESSKDRFANESHARYEASIVIPLLRQVDEWLDRSVLSALEQTAESEVVVVASPMTPASNLEILDKLGRRYPQLICIEREPHMRFAAAVNLGIRTAHARRVGLLFSDDWLDPRAVELTLAEDADIVSTAMLVFAANGTTVLKELSYPKTNRHLQQLGTLHEKASYLGHFFLFRRAALDMVTGLDETLGDTPGVDDFDMIWCMLERGATAVIVEHALYNCRDHDGERLTTRRIDEMVATFRGILDKHGVGGELAAQLMRDHSPWFGRPLLAVHRELQVERTAAEAASRGQSLGGRIIRMLRVWSNRN